MKLRIEEMLSGKLLNALSDLGYELNTKNEWCKYYRRHGFHIFINANSGECYGIMNASPFEVTERFKFIKDADTLFDLDSLAKKSWVGVAETDDEYKSRMSNKANFIDGVWLKKNERLNRQFIRNRRMESIKESVNDDTVYVVFRKERKPTEDDIFYGNDVTAFIYGAGIPVNYGKIMCYQHIGQHGEASLDYYNSLRPASPDEYADLLAELKSIYDDVNLVVRKKIDYNILRNEWRH